MRLLYPLVFLTFVLGSLGEAAPSRSYRPSLSDEQKKKSNDQGPEENELSPLWRSTRSSLQNQKKIHTLSLGTGSGNTLHSDQTESFNIFSYHRSLEDILPTGNENRIWEAGFGLSPQKFVFLDFSHRWNFSSLDVDPFDPASARNSFYGAVHIINFMDSSDFLAAFINLYHFKLQLHGGYSFHSASGSVIEPELAVGWGSTGVVMMGLLGFRFF